MIRIIQRTEKNSRGAHREELVPKFENL
ncbi:Protein of unknown function [Pyronema omphalodes CBS 100304]|uniref:Uncharacterized protein n=1 Tax=Pyronema omphalodes (strain CBS 100304) TaxID=1076935 RepID=U4L2Q1_PYROM|nr:Protein of unknown function [Pyronema omphalodes CBS 100304]